ncbi:M14 family zinc carboxypeptidase [Rummeliibacillus sp. JY-2-4R]
MIDIHMKGKRKFLYSACCLLSISLFTVQANAEGEEKGTTIETPIESSEDNSSNDTTNSNDNNNENPISIENGNNNQNHVISDFAKISLDTELFSPETLKPSKVKLPACEITYHVKQSTNEDYYEMEIGGNTYWIKAEGLQPSSEQQTKLTKNRKLKITSKSNFKIYSKNNLKSTILLEGTTPTSFEVLDVVDNFYVVSVAGVKGYIPFSQINITYKKNSNVEVATSSVKMYKIVSGKYKSVGTLVDGTVVKVAKSTTSYHIIQVGSQSYAITKNGTIPTEKSASLKSLVKETYPVTLQVGTTNSVYSSSGKKIGTIFKGQVVSLKALKGDQGIIDFMGKSGYVNLKYFNHSNMVNGSKNITYGMYNYYVRVIAQLYPEFTKVEKIGESVQGRSIYALRVGNGKKEILMDAALHAREHMTTNVLMEMIDTYTESYRKNSKYAGYNVKSTLDKTSIWFVPMMNPDGVTLVQKGLSGIDSKYRTTLKKYNQGSTNFNRWKANGRGVDLNRNFDGIWKYLAATPKSYMNYKGPSVFSEPESKALKAFVERHHFKTNLSYHSSGQIVYWFNFQTGSNRTRDLNLAKSVARITGYSVVPPLYYRGSGSSADWFILNQKKPGLTIEIAPYAGNGPVPHSYWSSVWNKNKTIGLFGANEASKR